VKQARGKMDSPLVIGTNGYVAAIDRQSGAEIWRADISGNMFSGPGRNDVTVLVADGVVFAGSHGHLLRLDLQTGRELWRNELTGMGHDDVALALEGVSIQFLQKVVRNSS
jgi:outer membrane protein assembly factor BamB